MEDTRYGSLAEEAGATVRERAEQYGPPEENLNHVAELWSAYLGVDLDGWDYAAMMILAKMARAKDGTLDKDTALDIAGYADAGFWASGLSDRKTYDSREEFIYDVT